jgi:serine/threonine protein kinase
VAVEDARSAGPSEPGAHTAQTLTGQLVDGRYRVGGFIASGGMARLYQARDERLDRPVAMKIIDAVHVTEPDFVAAFAREARIIARLCHPNVVAVFDQGSHAGLPFVVMEYVEGRTLRDLLNARGRLPLPDAIRLCRQVLAALSAAHRIDLVHRDIKPENILISASGEPDLVKVTDFGLAQAVQAGADAVDRDGPILATAEYLPPELIDTGTAGKPGDVYSAGILMYELLTGQVPFDGPDPVAVAHMHLDRTVPSPARLVPDLPDAVNSLVLHATARDPRDRPVDAAAFASQLDQIVVHSSAARGESRPVSPPARRPTSAPPPPPRPRRGLLVRLFAAMVAVLVLTVGGWWLADGRYTRAPSLLAQDAETITRFAQRHGVAVDFAPEQFSETIPAGAVLSQQPDPGERLLRGGDVTVTISRGPERYQLPNLLGRSESAARDALHALPVDLRLDYRYDAQAPPGEVVSSDPAAGDLVRPRSVVRVEVSKGPPPVEVPDITGRRRHDAERQLADAGLEAAPGPGLTDRDKVKRQSPEAGDTVDPGTAVWLYEN